MLGGLAIMNLPVAVSADCNHRPLPVSATYPGADAQTVEDSVTR